MLYLLIIFFSAFLLFQVQPIIAKTILPTFGGGAAIWTTCMLFFQGLLLLGYCYAHLVGKLSSIKQQVSVHSAMLLASLAFVFTGLLSTDLGVAGLFSNRIDETNLISSAQTHPVYQIVMLLFTSIGVPYFMLSSTGPLIQHWYSISKQKTPYKLYALSNVGSLLALVSYPFIFEPLLTLSSQNNVWLIAYSTFVSTYLILMYQLTKLAQQPTSSAQDNTSKAASINFSHLALWLLLAAVGVVLLVSTTNAMTQNIPPIPFLWILPLALYLTTFIIAFHSPRWYVRWYWFAFFILSAFVAMMMFFIGTQFDIVSQVVIYSFILFAACMICHGELAKLAPDTSRLTLYYLLISLGGFLGSAFVTFFAPSVFVQFTEFPLAIIATSLLFIACVALPSTRAEKLVLSKPVVLVLLLMTTTGLGFLFTQMNQLFNQHHIAKHRNFYGLLSVVDVDEDGYKERRLIDGSTSHGTQSLDENLSHIPKSYYREGTGVALALTHYLPKGLMIEPKNVGFIGLGAGTLAAYGRRGEYYRFYELNPAVEQFAQQHFSYLIQSEATIDIAIGDGRQLLQQELDEIGGQAFDILVLDAFSGDAIPTHLLTTQAFELYWQHMKDNGILAIHISNSHLDLTSLTRNLAKSVDKSAYYFYTPASKDDNEAQWVLVTSNQRFMNRYAIKQALTPWPDNNNNDVLWTDDYSNLLSVLK